jgi:hypothetical protein
MKIQREELINDLVQRMQSATEVAKALRELPFDKLNKKPGPQAWSALECFEHLNLYGDFYIPEIEKRILKQKVTPNEVVFRSGIIGNYFANLMLAENGKMKKMKSPKDKNPINSTLTLTTIDRFLKQQEHLLSLLERSKKIDLTGTKTSISLASFIQLRLGDTLRFVIYHIQRHVQQAQRAIRD